MSKYIVGNMKGLRLKLLDLPKVIQGTLVIQDLGTKGSNKERRVVVVCPDCNSTREIAYTSVRRGFPGLKCTTCRNIEIGYNKKPFYRTSLYNRWAGMKQRCTNPNSPDYVRYGARGVTVCNDWLNSFEAFAIWALDNGFKEDLVIDKDILCDKLKISPKLYSPKTCHWITKKENDTYKYTKAIYHD